MEVLQADRRAETEMETWVLRGGGLQQDWQEGTAYVKVRPASLYTLKTFSMALTYAAVLRSSPRLYLLAVRMIC